MNKKRATKLGRMGKVSRFLKEILSDEKKRIIVYPTPTGKSFLYDIYKNQELIDKMYNMCIDNTMLTSRQILFNPTKEQIDKFWCKKCDGFHNTKKCKIK